MKLLASALAIVLAVVLWAPKGGAAEIETFAYVSASVGAERETGTPWGRNSGNVGRAGGRGGIEALGMLPFAVQNLGLQGSLQYVGGLGSRFGVSAGPVYGWAGGKAGVFVNYQHRTLRDSDFLWITPAVALYYGQMNVNVSYTQPVSSPQKTQAFDIKRVDVPTNRLQGTVSYFPTFDLGALNVITGNKKNNLELTAGLQINTFGGPFRHEVQSAGVGPIVGMAVMPWQNVEVNVFKVTFDNRSRYSYESGVRVFFGKDNTSLLDWRHKYLDAGPKPVAGFTAAKTD
jgi:hypothetical protein